VTSQPVRDDDDLEIRLRSDALTKPSAARGDGGRGEAARLEPFPKGWYAVAFSAEIGPGKVETRKLAGREVVLFRTEQGAIAGVDPICPHLGAHMGVGGTVEGETLRCPFHAFRFGIDGACVATGYGTKPPKISAKTWSVVERHGVVLAWWDPSGGAPSFEIPELDMSAFAEQDTWTYRLRGHPQDTTENSVDTGHLSIVHGYQSVETLREMRADGAYLHARYAFERPVGLLGEGFGGVRAEFDVHVHGLGYSFVEVTTPATGLVFRNFVFATPISDMQLELRLASALRRLDDTPGIHTALGIVGRSASARRLLEKMIRKRAFAAYRNDVEQDFEIWKHKEFVPRPALAAGDGPVMRYRRWAEQFYERGADGKATHA
jgi:nitrite reductase/ring-hydroxylating ferredoxin subunit